EANSLRVLCRFFGWHEDPRTARSVKWLWQTAEAVLPAKRIGEFNQALMELGALVCTPGKPDCSACPLTRQCQARRQNLQADIPRRPASVPAILLREVAVVIRRGGQVLVAQRPAMGRWASLWEFPHGPVGEGEGDEDAAVRLARQLVGLDVDVEQELVTLKHGVTRYQITLVCFAARHQRGAFRSNFYQQGQWLGPGKLKDYPVSSPQRRLAQLVNVPH